MPIVSSYPPARTRGPSAELAIRKAKLREQIDSQKAYITRSTQQLLTPVAIISNLISLLGKQANVYDGVLFGYKIFQKFKDFFRKKQ